MVKKEPVDVFVKTEDNGAASELKKKKRPKRTQKDVQVDILRYRELLRNGQDMERDIPPRRSKRGVDEDDLEDDSDKEYKNETETEKFRACPPVPDIKDIATPFKTRRKGAPRKAKVVPTIPRPSYSSRQYTAPRALANKLRKYDTLPLPPISHTPHTYEDHVSMSMSYDEGINVINSTISRKSADDTIDISLQNGFLPKNVSHEATRFSLDSEYYQANSQCLHSSLFFSSDIDLFFDTLNGFGGHDDKRAKLYRALPLV